MAPSCFMERTATGPRPSARAPGRPGITCEPQHVSHQRRAVPQRSAAPLSAPSRRTSGIGSASVPICVTMGE